MREVVSLIALAQVMSDRTLAGLNIVGRITKNNTGEPVKAVEPRRGE